MLFGILGVLRRSWPQRIAGAIALYFAQVAIPEIWPFGSTAGGGLLGAAGRGIIDLFVTRPFDAALYFAHDSVAQATPLVAAYLVGIYLVIRLAVLRARGPVTAWAWHHPIPNGPEEQASQSRSPQPHTD